MVDIVLKLVNEEVEVSSTPDTVHSAVLFRVYASTAASKVTIRDADSNIIGSMTIPQGFVEIMEKRKTDTVACVPAALCTPVAYK